MAEDFEFGDEEVDPGQARPEPAKSEPVKVEAPATPKIEPVGEPEPVVEAPSEEEEVNYSTCSADYNGPTLAGCCQGEIPGALPEGRAVEALKDAFLAGKDNTGLDYDVRYIEGVPHIATKNAASTCVTANPSLLPNPIRGFGNIGGHVDPNSFIAHFNEQKNDASRIFFNPLNGQAQAVFNENEKSDSPRWRDQRSSLVLQFTPEWVAWNELISKENGVSQTDLGEFLEDYIKTIETEFQGALLETAKFFTANKTVAMNTAITAENGSVQLGYDEQVSGTLKAGTASFPSKFNITLAVFKGGSAYKVACTLRYRLHGQTIKFFPKIVNIDKVKDTAMQGVVDTIAEKTGTTVFLGTP